ncbi:MAG: 30S ribosomal protein S6--L-glutamate ligase [Planctomycetaceae bacterium]|nr:30S ribosomal protein S6--L-glutamate ligase [Planctomycetaceae bacterium]
MRLGVLAATDSWYLKDLQRAASSTHEVVGLSFSELTAQVSGDDKSISCGEVALPEFDAVLVRSMPPGSLEQVVFRMNALAQLEQMGVAVINSARSLETAIDKYRCAAELQCLPHAPRSFVCQTFEEAMRGFELLGGDVVIKPIFGGEGRGITRVSDPDLAVRAFKMLAQMNAVIFLQQFIPHKGFDIRLFLLGGRVFAMKRINPSDWRTNVSRGAATEPFECDDKLGAIARAAADRTEAIIAGIDILPGQDGKNYLLEVNAVPGWKALARTLNVDMSAEVLHGIDAVTRQKAPPLR